MDFKKLNISLIFCIGLSLAARSQDLGHLGKQKPFSFHGNIGGGVNAYSSNESSSTRDPFTWNLYGNFSPSIYNFSLPFSFVINQYSRSYTSPFTQFGISPTYKWIKLHLGFRNMPMSPFTFDGQSFKGVGIELTPKMFRFAAFYGSLNKAISEDTTSGHLAMPQYGRKGYGLKLGVGTAANHIDFIYFHAKDDSGSIRLINQTETLRPQENTVLGTSLKFTLLKRIIWSTDLAASALSQDLASSKVNKDTLHNSLEKFFSGLIAYRNGTVASWAGQSMLTLLLGKFNTTLGYRRVQPDFKSLGTPYMLNDIEAWQWNAGTVMAKGKLNVNANINTQHNNISHKAASELHNLTGSLTLGALLSTHANLGINLSAINLQQKDGTAHISDSVRLDQQIYTISVTPGFSFSNTRQAQSISASLTYSLVDDHNPVSSPYSKGNTLSALLNYSCAFILRSWSLNGSLLYNRYEQGVNLYTSYGFNAGAGFQFLKEKNLGFQLSAGYLLNHFSQGDAKNNITGSLNTHYTWQKKHSFSAYINTVVTPPNSLVQKLPYAVSTNNLAGGLAYNYSF